MTHVGTKMMIINLSNSNLLMKELFGPDPLVVPSMIIHVEEVVL